MIEVPKELTQIKSLEIDTNSLDPYHKISNINFEFENSLTFNREIIHRPESVAALFTCKDYCLLTRQFRAPTLAREGSIEKAFIYEVVAGCIDEGESPLECILREASEEVDLQITEEDVNFSHCFSQGYVSPGYTDEYQYLYVIDLHNMFSIKPTQTDEGEINFPKWLKIDEVSDIMHMVKDMKTLMLLNNWIND